MRRWDEPKAALKYRRKTAGQYLSNGLISAKIKAAKSESKGVKVG
jgi:hypothetical protein